MQCETFHVAAARAVSTAHPSAEHSARGLPTRVQGALLTALAFAFMPLVAFGASSPETQLLDGSNGKDWPAYGRTYGEGHFSPLSEINSGNADRLGLKWALDLPAGNSATTPLEVDGVLYFATGYSVLHAVDARTGKALWPYDPQVALQAGDKLKTGWGTRGIAWWDGKVFTATADGRLIAVDAATGKALWSAMTIGASDGRYITGAPRVFDGKVIIGHGGADFANVRGYVTAYDADTGKELWRFYTVPGNPADGPDGAASDSIMPMAATTWSGQWWKFGGGGTVWNAMTYDKDFDTVLLGTGNGSPWNHRVRSAGKGDNLFLCSIVAVDAKTGKYKWHYQINPGETWDYNAAMDMQLGEFSINGVPRKVVVTAPKNGFFYVIDRTNGKLISAEPIVEVNWATRIDIDSGRPVEVPGARYPDGTSFTLRPSFSGAHNWTPMSFNPVTGYVYIPTLNMATRFNDKGINAESWSRQPGVVALNGGVNFEYVLDDSIPGLKTSSLLAWDPVRQKEVWRINQPDFWNGGVLSTAGNLVFQGEVNGQFTAYDGVSGRTLWKFDAQAPILAGAISYELDGRQYVTVLTGYGFAPAAFGPLVEKYQIDYRTQKRRVLTFALDGRAQLPPLQPKVPRVVPSDPTYVRNDESAARGLATFGTKCGICHGFNAVAGGNAPDLRYSPVPSDASTFAAIVRDGALLPLGMPRFNDLTDAELLDLRQYLRSRARE